jgi:hypothetical protein
MLVVFGHCVFFNEPSFVNVLNSRANTLTIRLSWSGSVSVPTILYECSSTRVTCFLKTEEQPSHKIGNIQAENQDCLEVQVEFKEELEYSRSSLLLGCGALLPSHPITMPISSHLNGQQSKSSVLTSVSRVESE